MDKEVAADKDSKTITTDQLQRLLEISTKLSSTLHLSDLLQLLMDVSTELTDTQVASILLVEQRTGQLHFVASTGSAMSKQVVVPLDGSIAGWVVRNGRPVVLDDVQTDDRWYRGLAEGTGFLTNSMLAVPLITGGRVIGTLEVINKQAGASFNAQDIALMEALASQAAVAIVNARLFEQSDLLAEIMHELKTPLMAITSASELLSHPDFPVEKHDEIVQMIKREAQRLSKMTRDFLEYARMESGRVRFDQQSIDIPQLVDEIVWLTQSQAADRNITIDTDLPENLSSTENTLALVGDYDRLKQVLLNLVSNAVKFNRDNGRVVIGAHTRKQKLHLNIKDTGSGIDSVDVERLFERFYRVPGSETREGSGLGLAISNKIVEQHGGRIEVESIQGQGTTFTVILPLTSTA